MPAGTVTFFGVFDAETSGNFLWGGSLTSTRVVNAGDTFQFGVGDVDVVLD